MTADDQLSLIHDRVVSRIRPMKERAARRRDHNLRSVVEFHRGGQLIAVVTLADLNRDLMLRVVRLGLPGYDADHVALMAETWSPTPGYMNNPRTGEPWVTGEMQEAVDKYDALGQGVITDALMVTVYERPDARVRASLHPYRVVRKNLLWGEVTQAPDAAEHSGVIPHAIREAMGAMTATDFMERYGVLEALQKDPQLSAAGLRAAVDAVVTRKLNQLLPCAIALVVDENDPERAQTLADLLPPHLIL